MIRLKDQYDWVVLGDHPGALLSAGLAARLGMSVLILPLVPRAKMVVSESGQYLDPEPNRVLALGRMERGKGLLAEALARLGILPSELARISQDKVLPQVATLNRRLSFMFEDDEFGRELDREFGSHSSGELGLAEALSRSELPILSFWKDLPTRLSLPTGAKPQKREPHTLEEVRRRLEQTASGKAAARWFAGKGSLTELGNHEKFRGFREVCLGLWHGFTEIDGEEPGLSELVHLLVLGRTAASFQGGLTAYRDFLVRVAKRLGAHAPQETVCRRLFVENGRFAGVQISHRGNVLGVKGGVIGCSLEQSLPFVFYSGRKWPHRLKAPPKPTGWRFSIGVVVRAEAIPPGMHSRLVWSEPGAPALEIEVADPADYGSTEPGKKWLFARSVLPYSPETLKVGYLRTNAARMLRQLSEVMPFLEYHIVRVFPDFRSDTGEISKVFDYPSLETVPENLRVYHGGGVGSQSGVEGLFVASGESFPRLGSFGPTIAALEATAWLAQRSGLSGPFA